MYFFFFADNLCFGYAAKQEFSFMHNRVKTLLNLLIFLLLFPYQMLCLRLHVTTCGLLSTILHLFSNAHGKHFLAKATRIVEMETPWNALPVDVPLWVSMPLRQLGDSIWKLRRRHRFAVSWITVENSFKHCCSGLFCFYADSLYYQALQS